MDDHSFDDPEIARKWIQSIEGDGAKIRETDIYPILREWAHGGSFSEVLEIGCGQGAASFTVPEFSEYTGIDPSGLLLSRARELYGKTRRKFALGNAYALPFPDQHFDAAFSVTVWHLLKDIKLAASELSRVLKDKGQFLIMTANPEAYVLWEKIFTESKLVGNRLEGMIVEAGEVVAKDVLYLHSLDELLDSLKQSQLSVNKCITIRNDTETGLQRFICIYGEK